MTILSVVQNVSVKVGIARPSEVYTSTDRDMYEMQQCISEAATDILECHDWELLRTVQTVTGDDASSSFSLPSDYERMLKDSNLWSSRWTDAMTHIPSSDEWLEAEVVPYVSVEGEWTIYGGLLYVRPVMASTETAKFFYISNLIVSPDSGDDKAAFDADDDTFRLNEKLLQLGITWKWREKKGQPYAEDMQNYEQHKIYLMDKDSGSKPVVGGRRVSPRKGKLWAFPQTVGG